MKHVRLNQYLFQTAEPDNYIFLEPAFWGLNFQTPEMYILLYVLLYFLKKKTERMFARISLPFNVNTFVS